MGKVLVIRAGAMGDVLLATPIVARLKKEDPQGTIDVQTRHPYVFWGNPNVSHYQNRGGYDRVIDLDMAFESRGRSLHAVDAYSEVAFGDRNTPRELFLNYAKPPYALFDYGKCVAFHPARSWPSRTMPREFWQKFVDRVRDKGIGLVAIGTRQDWEGPWGNGVCDTRGKLTLAQQAAVINACPVVVCSDTGLMSVAHATESNIIALLTISKPEPCLFVRHGRLGWGFHPVMANVPCVGCGQNREQIETYFVCNHVGTDKENYCVESFDPIDIAQAAVKLTKPALELVS